ncbi:hypothetical protein FRB96_007809 [Tulasnella sp. 330]|nr:hypothetical protein FRB96_007809 [Tulasnella sp. 330]
MSNQTAPPPADADLYPGDSRLNHRHVRDSTWDGQKRCWVFRPTLAELVLGTRRRDLQVIFVVAFGQTPIRALLREFETGRASVAELSDKVAAKHPWYLERHPKYFDSFTHVLSHCQAFTYDRPSGTYFQSKRSLLLPPRPRRVPVEEPHTNASQASSSREKKRKRTTRVKDAQEVTTGTTIPDDSSFPNSFTPLSSCVLETNASTPKATGPGKGGGLPALKRRKLNELSKEANLRSPAASTSQSGPSKHESDHSTPTPADSDQHPTTYTSIESTKPEHIQHPHWRKHETGVPQHLHYAPIANSSTYKATTAAPPFMSYQVTPAAGPSLALSCEAPWLQYQPGFFPSGSTHRESHQTCPSPFSFRLEPHSTHRPQYQDSMSPSYPFLSPENALCPSYTASILPNAFDHPNNPDDNQQHSHSSTSHSLLLAPESTYKSLRNDYWDHFQSAPVPQLPDPAWTISMQTTAGSTTHSHDSSPPLATSPREDTWDPLVDLSLAPIKDDDISSMEQQALFYHLNPTSSSFFNATAREEARETSTQLCQSTMHWTIDLTAQSSGYPTPSSFVPEGDEFEGHAWLNPATTEAQMQRLVTPTFATGQQALTLQRDPFEEWDITSTNHFDTEVGMSHYYPCDDSTLPLSSDSLMGIQSNDQAAKWPLIAHYGASSRLLRP